MRTAISPDRRSFVPPGPASCPVRTPWPICPLTPWRRRHSPRPEHPADLPSAVIELVVEVDRGADQGQVTERLREVAELTAGAVDLLGVQAQVVDIGEHLLEDQ